MLLRGYYAILDVPSGYIDWATSGALAPRPVAASDPTPEVAERGDAHQHQHQHQHQLENLVERARGLLAARPCMLQIRAKGASAATLAAVARAILPEARAAGVPLCVNDRLDVALIVGADAVHLGQDDLPLADARNVARGRLVIGISTHNQAQAQAAVAGGADYIGFGPIFTTTTKVRPDPVVGVAALREIAAGVAVTVPVIAIGGITLAQVTAIAATGAAAAALIGAMDTAPDPAAAGRVVRAAFGDFGEP